jgi:predicted deacylase
MPRDQVEQDKADVINIMKYLGIIDGDPLIYVKQNLRETEMFSPVSGCWYPDMHAGDSFRCGDRLGIIKDYFGETMHEILAPENGMMLHQTASLNIIEGGPMISYGIPDHTE